MKHKFVSFLALVALLGSGALVYTAVLHADKDGADVNNSSDNKEPEGPKYNVDETALDTSMNAILESTTMDVSISITDLTTNKKYHYGDTAPYTAASVTKLLTASLYLQNVQDGTMSLDDVVGGKKASTQLEQLIVNSDNAAWDALVIKLKQANLNAYSKELGMTSFNAATNVITSDDLTILLTKLYKHELLNDENTQLLLGFMLRAGEHDHLPPITTPGITAYHKAGWLDDRAHDALIITNDKHAFAMSVFTKTEGTYDVAAGIDFFNRVNAATIDAFLLKQP